MSKKTKAANKSDLVAKFRYFAKDKLCPYPDEAGTPFYVGKDNDEKKFFAKGTIFETRNPENEEMFCRMGMGMCLGASSFHHGAHSILKRINIKADESTNDKTVLEGNMFAKTGYMHLVELLRSDQGKDFVEAIDVLNVGLNKKPSKSDVSKAIDTFTRFLHLHEDELRKDLGRIASFAASSYLFAMTLIEHVELHTHKRKWAKQMQKTKTQPKAVNEWIKNPNDELKFTNALTEAFMQKVKGNVDGTRKQRKADDSSSENNDKNSKSSDSSNDGKLKSKKAKCRYSSSDSDDNTKHKKAKKDSSESSSDDKKKKKKKFKKEKAKKSSSSSSSEKNKKDKKKTKKNKKNCISSTASDEEKDGKEKKKKKDKVSASSDDSAAPAKKAKVTTLGNGDCEKEKTKEERDGTAIWTTWPTSDAQSVAARIEMYATNYALKECTIKDLKETVSKIPMKVLEFSKLDAVIKRINEMEKLPVKSEIEKDLGALREMCQTAVAFLEAGAEDATSSF